MYNRIASLDLSAEETVFLWGPRQTGKSTLLNSLFPKARKYDLLLSDTHSRMLIAPETIREECFAAGLSGENQMDPIIIDEIQKAPKLLDEVHWLIENRNLRFVLCGSSARRIKREHGNLLGGRAVKYEMFPLVSPEVPDFDLQIALNTGLLPRAYGHRAARRILQSYVDDYMREEIAAESYTRNIPAFARFLEIAGHSNGEIMNYSNIASECGVSSPTVREYFSILEDTLLGTTIQAFRRRAKRRQILAPKFYFFDVGIVAYLTRRGAIEEKSEMFGRAFEHFLFCEIRAHSAYREMYYPITYWRTASGFEVDFVLGNGEAAIEVKSSDMIRPRHLKGIRAFKEEFNANRYVVVSRDSEPRRTEDGIDILPWRMFLEQLWQGSIVR